MYARLTLYVVGAALVAAAGCQDRPSPAAPLTQSPDLSLNPRIDAYDLEVFDPPGSISSAAYDVNAHGDVLGHYRSPDGAFHVYIRSSGEYRIIDHPGAASTYAGGMNDPGDIVGRWSDGSTTRGFLLHNGEYTDIEVPGATRTEPREISDNGTIVGSWYEAASGKSHGFVLRDGRITNFDVPGAEETQPYGLNARGEIVGHYVDLEKNPAYRYEWWPFLRRSDGTILTDDLARPDGVAADAEMGIWGINARGDWAGWFLASSGDYIGFVRDSQGGFTMVPVPDSPDSGPLSINAAGVVVGITYDASWVAHGFLAVPR